MRSTLILSTFRASRSPAPACATCFTSLPVIRFIRSTPTIPRLQGRCGASTCTTVFTENIDIVGAPVIDQETQTLFAVARTKENSGFVQRLHVLDITTGTARPSSLVVIRASVPGTADGFADGMITFDPAIHDQRGVARDRQRHRLHHLGVALRYRTYHGWLIGYDRKTLAQVVAKSMTPNGKAGGIWQSHSGPSFDESDTLYLSVGNGTVTAPSGGTDYGNAFLSIGPGAVFEKVRSPVDAFRPFE
jgi:hypothetical protein